MVGQAKVHPPQRRPDACAPNWIREADCLRQDGGPGKIKYQCLEAGARGGASLRIIIELEPRPRQRLAPAAGPSFHSQPCSVCGPSPASRPLIRPLRVRRSNATLSHCLEKPKWKSATCRLPHCQFPSPFLPSRVLARPSAAMPVVAMNGSRSRRRQSSA